MNPGESARPWYEGSRAPGKCWGTQTSPSQSRSWRQSTSKPEWVWKQWRFNTGQNTSPTSPGMNVSESVFFCFFLQKVLFFISFNCNFDSTQLTSKEKIYNWIYNFFRKPCWQFCQIVKLKTKRKKKTHQIGNLCQVDHCVNVIITLDESKATLLAWRTQRALKHWTLEGELKVQLLETARQAEWIFTVQCASNSQQQCQINRCH